MKGLLVLALLAQGGYGQYGPPRKTNVQVVPQGNDQANEISPPGLLSSNRATNFWWAGANSPFRPGSQLPPCNPGQCANSGSGFHSPGSYPSGQPGTHPSGHPQPGSPSGHPQPGSPSGYPQPGSPSGQPGQPQPGAFPSGQPQPQPGQSFLGQPQPGYPSGQLQQPAPLQPVNNNQLPQEESSSQGIDIQSNPFLSSALQKPIPSSSPCTTPGKFCAPASNCGDSLPHENGNCGGGQVCCKSLKPAPFNPGQGQAPYNPGQGQAPAPFNPGQAPSPGQGGYNPNQQPFNNNQGQQIYKGPINTEIPKECAAALKCVDISYCTQEGVMSDSPVVLTREQLENRVPLSDCQNPDNGKVGKCCRDPNYKDPWPAGMMMNKPGAFGNGPVPQQPASPVIYPGQGSGFYNPGQPQPGFQTPNQPQPGFQAPSQQQPGFQSPNQPQPGFPSQQKPATSQPGSYNPGQPQPGFQAPNQPQPGFQAPSQQKPTPGQGYPGSYNPGQQQPGFQAPNQPQPGFQAPNQPQPGFQQPQQPQPGFQAPNQPKPGFQAPNQPQPGFQAPSQPNQGSYNPGQSQPGFQSPNQAQPGFQAPNQPQPSFPAQPGFQSPSQPSPTFPQPGFQPQTPQQPSPGYQPQPFPGQTPQKGFPPSGPKKSCGTRQQPYSNNNDDSTNPGEFPWHVAILSAANRTILCSGSIVSDNAVLTSAHCLQGLEGKDILVKAGPANSNSPAQIRTVAAIVNHPSYDSGSLVKDQAVLALSEPLNLKEDVDKVCLPPADTNQQLQNNGKNCFITGFGRPSPQGPSPSLHKISVSAVGREQCENSLKQSYLGKYFILNEGFSCAAPNAGGTFCTVDIGSGLVCERPDGQYELVGVYSWDTSCQSSTPAVIANCDVPWINQVIGTDVAILKENASRQRPETMRPEDIDSKPGFALGYGK